MQLFTFLFLAIGVTAQYQTNLPVDNRTLDQLYSAAQQERQPQSVPEYLRVFFGGDAGVQGASIRNAWKQRFPDIPLNLTVDLSKYISSRIDRGWASGISVADVATMQTLQDFKRWKDEGKILFYKPPTFSDLLQSEKDFDGAFVPFAIISLGTLKYNPRKLALNEVPTSFADFINPKWRGKLILTYPNDDDAVCYLFSNIVSRYGVEWLYALAANDVKWVRGTQTPVTRLAASANNSADAHSITFTTGVGDPSLNASLPAAPEQVFTWAQRGAIIQNTPQPTAAKLFIAWLTSQEFQSSSVAGINATAALGTVGTTLISLNQQIGASLYDSPISDITKFREFERDRVSIERWKNLFEDVLGTAQGPSPLQVYPNPPATAG